MPTPLNPEVFRRYDETPDEHFYKVPRFVQHIDEAAVAAVTQLYREYFPVSDGAGINGPRRPVGGAVLDLMSSWVSHLPEEVSYRRVVGLGMNAQELAANPRLTEFVVQSLNANPILPFEDDQFDACGICVSIQYLTDPVTVLSEVGRVCRPGAPLVITFSNRCFPSKAVAAWLALSDADHLKLVAAYLTETGHWQNITTLNRTPSSHGDPLYAVVGFRANGLYSPYNQG